MMDVFAGAPLAVLWLTAGLASMQAGKRLIRDLRAKPAHTPRQQGRRLPQLTIVAQPRKLDNDFAASIRSVMRSNYRRLHLIIIANAPDIAGREMLGDLQKRYPKRISQVSIRRTKQPLLDQTILRRYGRSGMLLLLDAPYMFDGQTLVRIVQESERTGASLLHIRREKRAGSWISIMADRYVSLFFADEQDGLKIYRMEGRRAHHFGTSLAIPYLGQRAAARLRFGINFVLGLCYCCIIVLALWLRDPLMFAAGWTLFSVSQASLVLTDSKLEARQKWRYFQHMPVAYVLFCVQFLLHVLSRPFKQRRAVQS